ncbi:MAG: UbiD family decarboxylase [Nanoarchaeota archaeon]|nr:UbiD family decarboxylase [Nanoarchaeota archaeon]MBU4300107.1 UbiD family decarboxylase [Nanoarchaeota archaeon]MBU4452309.1 UbiD family decarboxylase [Nanoarchaeota archaeon]MCG2723835.1 UbiD family decarboxylase [archaeon]
MDLRELLNALKKDGELIEIEKEVDANLEIAGIIKKLDGKAILFKKVKNSAYPVVSGIASQRKYFALGLGIKESEILQAMAKAAEKPKQYKIVETAACQEVVEKNVDLNKLPILLHTKDDGGRYISSGVAIIKDNEFGPNISFHRMMQIGKNKFTARLVENRGTDAALKKSVGDLQIAICIGNPIQILLAAAMSVPRGIDEAKIANALSPTNFVKCKTKDLYVPADSEFILEGRITHKITKEGPFVDLTETMDFAREQPIIEIDCITHRIDAMYHALLPGGLEHKLLMGMPREPTIFNEVNKVAKCTDITITTGGCSWLHAIVQIEKKCADDGRKAIEAAFRGHGSLKQCIVVDTDIDIRNPAEVEWAIATRFQSGRGLVVLKDADGSSLDPSARHEPGKKSKTDKLGIDATIPFGADKNDFKKVKYQDVDIKKYL